MDQCLIMYVEDDPDIRELMQLVMEQEDSITLVTSDPAPDIVERIRRIRPDLLLLDVMMPGVGGASIAGKLRADPDLKTLPFVFITAKARSTEQAELLSLEPLAIIAKPFDVLHLPNQLQALMRQVQAR